MLIAIEGIDGAGKRTLTEAIAGLLAGRGLTCAATSFPQYGRTRAARGVQELLNLEPEELARIEPREAAAWYALDRFESRGLLAGLRAGHDVVLIDRWIASNIAYQRARAPAAEGPGLEAWILELETGLYGLPVPDATVLVATPETAAADLIRRKGGRDYTDKAFDALEANRALQARVLATYHDLAARGVLGRWIVLHPVRDGTLRPPADLAAEVVAALLP